MTNSYWVCQWGSGVEPLTIVTSMPVDGKKILLEHQNTSSLRKDRLYII